MNPIDPASIPQHVVDAAWNKHPFPSEPEDDPVIRRAMRPMIAAALTALMDDEPVQVIDEFDGEPGEVLPADVLAAVLKRQAA